MAGRNSGHPPLHRKWIFVIPLQVITNVASVVVGDIGPSAWRHVFLMVDFLFCFLILSSIVWSIWSLRETAKSGGKAARNLAKLVAFRKFYVAVVRYLYFTRVAVLAIRAIMSYEYQWVGVAVEEVVSFAFYAFVFYMSRRRRVMLDDIDEEAAMVALTEE